MRHTLNEDTETESNITAWADLMSNHAGIQELTAEILNELVSRIVVHDRRMEDGVLRQTVDIHYRFVGLLNETDYPAKVLKNGTQ